MAPQIVIDIINEELAKTEFSDIIASAEEYFLIGNDNILYPNDPFHDIGTRLLERVSTDRFKSNQDFYHFKKADRIIDVLRQKTILAANLPAHSANDNEEYAAFLKILGRDEWLLPLEEEHRWFPEYGSRRIDDWRGGVHIFCLTKSITDWMWASYAGTEDKPATGAALLLSFEEFNESETELIQPLYDFRDVIYDNENGDRFAFFKKIETRVLAATGKIIIFSKMPRFAKFYKRNPYHIEDETRLAFDSKYSNISYRRYLQNHYALTYYAAASPPWGHLTLPIFDQSEPKDQFHPFMKNLRLGLPSPHFKIVLKRIILGKNMPIGQRNEIERLVKLNFPSCGIEPR